MISSIERNQLRMSKSKKKIDDMKKKLSEEDKLRLQSIDQALRNLSSPQEIKEEIIQDKLKTRRVYNKNKYKEVERETAQVELEEVVKNTFLAHPNLEVLKFVIDQNEDDIEIVLEEPLMQSDSCMAKKYKKKDLVRVMDVLIKNVSISVIDNVLWNSVEKLYRVNKDFDIYQISLHQSQYMKSKDVNLSILMTLDTNQIVTGQKQFTQSIQADQFIKINGTDDQILLANGDTTDMGDFLRKHYLHALGQMIIEPNDDIRNQGLRLIKNKANWDSFVLTGCNTNTQDRDGVQKMGSTSSQFRIQKQEDRAYDYKGLIIDFDCSSPKFNNKLVVPLLTPPIEYATQQTLGIGVLDFFTWGQATLLNNRVYISIGITHTNPNNNVNSGYTPFSVINEFAKPKFSGSSRNMPLNAVFYMTKQSSNPVLWTNAVVIDCFIDPDV
ncbi:MAG: hypothetical protein EZS28_017917 [Streblomastix strix]|uniref:Uncharacterized protein n=1 Tax=Streblomastix strix TaxID=222440 RepID=A0A5J4VVI4_9EUKA|nr:MAG: hypothetical protein EZS28_017917 [Streblomastix strix]